MSDGKISTSAAESKREKFPLEPCLRSYTLIREYLDSIKHTGPVGLSCDDTKLFPAFRPYWDASEEAHYVVGCAGSPVRIVNIEDFTSQLQRGLLEKATKVSVPSNIKLLYQLISSQIRLWCVQVPLPNVAPAIVAARAIPDKVPAEELVRYQLEILCGLIDQKINVVSSASDGSATERSMQRKLTLNAGGTWEYRIRHPKPTDPGKPDIITSIPIFKGQPVVMVQDAKHAAKTARNNAYTGAKLLTLGNYIAMYSQIRRAAFAHDGPLYRKDVEKVDRQDDNAACRLLSAATLRWFVANPKGEDVRGLIVYLFLMGELVDAYQSRTLPHVERVKMVLRLHFFLERWEAFLGRAGYGKSTHFVSHQFRDILRYLIFGLIQLVIVYRDTYKSRFPLLLWLHSTEICEHVFGLLRTLVKDFTMLDFYQMVKKLFIRLRMFTQSTLPAVDKSTDAGYTQTYADCRGIDLTALSAFPTDEQINEAARQAYDEADSLLSILGVSPDLFTEPTADATPSTTPWEQVDDFDDDDDEFNDDTMIDEAAEISHLYECAETLEGSSISPDRQRQIKDLSRELVILHTRQDTDM